MTAPNLHASVRPEWSRGPYKAIGESVTGMILDADGKYLASVFSIDRDDRERAANQRLLAGSYEMAAHLRRILDARGVVTREHLAEIDALMARVEGWP